MVIPEHLRSNNTYVGSCNTLAEIKEGIVKLTELADLQCVPLRHVTCRFNVPASKLGLKVDKILHDMEVEGLIGVKRVQALNRTFVFSAFAWEDLMASEADGSLDWEKYANALRDYK